MTERVHLVAGGGSHQVAEALLQLLQAAQAGHIRGVIFAVALKGSESYYCDSAGSLHRDPVKALGASIVLQRELESLIGDRDVETLY